MDDHYPVTDRLTRRAELAAIDDLTVIMAGAEGLDRRLRDRPSPTDEECARLLRAIAAAAARVARTLNAAPLARDAERGEPTDPYAERRRVHARDN